MNPEIQALTSVIEAFSQELAQQTYLRIAAQVATRTLAARVAELEAQLADDDLEPLPDID